MSQYRAAMTRLFGGENASPAKFSPRQNAREKAGPPLTISDFIDSLLNESIVDTLYWFYDPIMNFGLPCIWCLLLVLISDRDSFLGYWYMPFLGIFAAILCNSVPIGGGVVYVPALALLGVDMHLGVSFSVAVMTFGNGGLGFLRWLKKDRSLFIWESFQYTVIPSSLGTLIAMLYFPPMEVSTIRKIFATFCALLALLVLAAIYRGGKIENIVSTTPMIKEVVTDAEQQSSTAQPHCDLLVEQDSATELPPAPFDLEENNEPSSNNEAKWETKTAVEAPRGWLARAQCTLAWAPELIGDDELQVIAETAEAIAATEAESALSNTRSRRAVVEREDKLRNSWYSLGVVSFLAGFYLVPNIGIGPALTTFLGLQLMGFPPKAAIVTGIVTGGWVSVLPFLLHWLWLNDVPFQLWIMVLPGVFFGAMLAPYSHDYIGIQNILAAFALFLVATAYLFFFH